MGDDLLHGFDVSSYPQESLSSTTDGGRRLGYLLRTRSHMLSDTNPYAALPTAAPTLTSASVSGSQPSAWFAVSPLKLVLMSLCTLNLYLFYWHHEQWAALKRSRGDNVSPLARAIFSIFYTHKLFGEIADAAGERAAGLHAGLWATAYVGFLIFDRVVSRLDVGGIGLLGLAAPLFVLPIQREINRQLREANPSADLNERFGPLNIVALVLGTGFLGLILIGLFMLPPAT